MLDFIGLAAVRDAGRAAPKLLRDNTFTQQRLNHFDSRTLCEARQGILWFYAICIQLNRQPCAEILV